MENDHIRLLIQQVAVLHTLFCFFPTCSSTLHVFSNGVVIKDEQGGSNNHVYNTSTMMCYKPRKVDFYICTCTCTCDCMSVSVLDQRPALHADTLTAALRWRHIKLVHFSRPSAAKSCRKYLTVFRKTFWVNKDVSNQTSLVD